MGKSERESGLQLPSGAYKQGKMKVGHAAASEPSSTRNHMALHSKIPKNMNDIKKQSSQMAPLRVSFYHSSQPTSNEVAWHEWIPHSEYGGGGECGCEGDCGCEGGCEGDCGCSCEGDCGGDCGGDCVGDCESEYGGGRGGVDEGSGEDESWGEDERDEDESWGKDGCCC